MSGFGINCSKFCISCARIAVLFELIRGFIKVKEKTLGNYWGGITRIVLYVLIPVALVESILLIFQGVPQSGKEAQKVQLVEPIAVDKDGNTIQDAVINVNKVIVNEKVVEDAQIVKEQIVPL